MTREEFKETSVSCFWLTEAQAEEWLADNPCVTDFTQEDIEEAHRHFASRECRAKAHPHGRNKSGAYDGADNR